MREPNLVAMALIVLATSPGCDGSEDENTNAGADAGTDATMNDGGGGDTYVEAEVDVGEKEVGTDAAEDAPEDAAEEAGDAQGPTCTPTPIDELNTEFMDATPEISADGLTLYFTSDRPGGAGLRDIWYATRPNTNAPFGQAVNLAEINSPAGERGPAISADGLTIYFTSDRSDGVGGPDIWYATRSDVGAAFGEPKNLAELNTATHDSSPCISSDGLTVYFTSDRPGGKLGLDIWTATRSSVSEPFGEPTNVAELNTDVAELTPSLTADGLTIFFTSNRVGGAGSYDIWYALRAQATLPFEAPKNAAALNSSMSDESAGVSADGQTIYFHRGGSTFNSYDLFVARLNCP